MHVLAMCCEDSDVDKAEVFAMRVAECSVAQLCTKEIATGYLRTIRDVMTKSKMKMVTDRSNGWPFSLLLRPL